MKEYDGNDYVYEYPYTSQHAVVIVYEPSSTTCPSINHNDKIVYTIQCGNHVIYNNDTTINGSPVAIEFESSTQKGYCIRTYVNQLQCCATIQQQFNNNSSNQLIRRRTEFGTILTCGMMNMNIATETNTNMNDTLLNNNIQINNDNNNNNSMIVSVHIQEIISSSSSCTNCNHNDSTTTSSINNTSSSKIMISLNRLCDGQFKSMIHTINQSSCYMHDDNNTNNQSMEWSNHSSLSSSSVILSSNQEVNDTYNNNNDQDWSYCYTNGMMPMTGKNGTKTENSSSTLQQQHQDVNNAASQACIEISSKKMIIPGLIVYDSVILTSDNHSIATIGNATTCPLINGYEAPDVASYLTFIHTIIDRMLQ